MSKSMRFFKLLCASPIELKLIAALLKKKIMLHCINLSIDFLNNYFISSIPSLPSHSPEHMMTKPDENTHVYNRRSRCLTSDSSVLVFSAISPSVWLWCDFLLDSIPPSIHVLRNFAKLLDVSQLSNFSLDRSF